MATESTCNEKQRVKSLNSGLLNSHHTFIDFDIITLNLAAIYVQTLYHRIIADVFRDPF